MYDTVLSTADALDLDKKELQDKLTNKDTTTEEKNTIYEKIKTIQANSGTEESIEKKIKSTHLGT